MHDAARVQAGGKLILNRLVIEPFKYGNRFGKSLQTGRVVVALVIDIGKRLETHSILEDIRLLFLPGLFRKERGREQLFKVSDGVMVADDSLIKIIGTGVTFAQIGTERRREINGSPVVSVAGFHQLKAFFKRDPFIGSVQEFQPLRPGFLPVSFLALLRGGGSAVPADSLLIVKLGGCEPIAVLLRRAGRFAKIACAFDRIKIHVARYRGNLGKRTDVTISVRFHRVGKFSERADCLRHLTAFYQAGRRRNKRKLIKIAVYQRIERLSARVDRVLFHVFIPGNRVFVHAHYTHILAFFKIQPGKMAVIDRRVGGLTEKKQEIGVIAV